MPEPATLPDRHQPVLLFLPDQEEHRWTEKILHNEKIPTHTCPHLSDLCPKTPDRFTLLAISDAVLDSAAKNYLQNLIRTEPKWSKFPILIFTNSESRLFSNGFADGTITFLQRPLESSALLDVVSGILSSSDRRNRSGEPYAPFFAHTNDSLIVVDRDWKITYANPGATKKHHWSTCDLSNKTLWKTAPEFSAEPICSRLKEVAETQRESQIEIFDSSTNRWTEKRLYPFQDGVAILGIDITERKQSEELLRHQLNATQAITANAADSLFLLDADGCVTFMNPAAEETFGWKKEELLNRSLHDHVHYHRSSSTRLSCPLHSAFTSGLPLRDLEEQFTRKDGSVLYVSCSNAPIIVDGQIAGAVLAVHDITYRKLAEYQLRALNENLERRVAERTAVAEKRASQLRALASELTQIEQRERRRLAHILHDNLQQILVAAKLQISMLRERATPDGEHEKMLRAEDLIHRAIEQSRSLTVELSPPILYDSGLAHALEWLARRMQQQYGLEVSLETNPEADPTGDDIRAFLFSAIREMLFNIVKHAGVKTASVKIGLFDTETSLVEIRDEGDGFPTGPSEPNDLQPGGFGLFSIRERLEFLGGKMEILSSPGEGTTVSLYVPNHLNEKPAAAEILQADHPLAEAVAEEADAGASTEKNIRILIADDHKMLRDGLAGFLRVQPNMTLVGEASDGLQAIDLTHQLQPDVIIMDISMPCMNGVEATRRLTAEFPQIRIIGLSMHEKDDMANAMLEAGAVGYVTKGASSETLTATIRDCMKANQPQRTSDPASKLGN